MRKGLILPGWDERSTWGYDDGQASYFAQLWHNGVGEDPIVEARRPGRHHGRRQQEDDDREGGA